MNPRKLATILSLCAAVAYFSGCQSPFQVPDKASNPRVFSIGSQAVLSFDRNTPLLVPIEGRNLYEGLKQRIDVTITGTVPPGPDDYIADTSAHRAGSDILNVILRTNYLSRIKTGDTIEVAVHMHQFIGLEGALASLRRTFASTNTLISTNLLNSTSQAVAMYVTPAAETGVEAIHYIRWKLQEAQYRSSKWLPLKQALQPLFEAAEEYQSRDMNSQDKINDAAVRLARQIQRSLPELEAVLALFTENPTLFEQWEKGRAVYTSARSFTLFEVQSYRDHLQAKRISPENILAFPLPNEEADKLFGRRIANNYFVVRLSVRNTEPDDRIISTGMIRARGRAIVAKSPGYLSTEFTVPVEVSPHSLQQVYAVLTDTAPDTTRAVFFRSLEFAGAIATASMVGFGATELEKDALNVATSVAVPGLKELFPDKEPGFRRNLVNFGMEDLVKVGKGSVTSHKFLFFPKKAIEGLIIDQLSYNWTPEIHFEGTAEFGIPSRSLHPPAAQIAYLIVDNLEIPFENVFQPAPADMPTRVLNLKVEVKQIADTLSDLNRNWYATNSKVSFGSLSVTSVLSGSNQVLAQLEAIGTNYDQATKTNEPGKALSAMEGLARALEPDALHKGPLFRDLQTLEKNIADLEQVQNALTGGQPPSKYESTLAEISSVRDRASMILKFYSNSASLLADKVTFSALRAAAVSKTLAPDLRDRLHELADIRKTQLPTESFPDLDYFEKPPDQPKKP